ncbi:MazG-like family protein [Streptomyces albidus (ex Kaewkla and Franco 2022)]|uniref:MazG-like family protein n=1 Tax=Streptomyces albidus (ex Kaewkla and Franco 2022) TaxID=722709 RepID=UPI001F350EE4|nr:MazG-like family protein [Streptomyces albidus (ex Kaewkla and Franco 2022)]
MTPEQWATIRRLVEWLDTANGVGEQETAMRLMKLAEESGEVMQAYIGTRGQNPRKGHTHTSSDVAAELCDVILTAAVALHRFTDDPAAALDEKIRQVALRSLPPEPLPPGNGHPPGDGQAACGTAS